MPMALSGGTGQGSSWNCVKAEVRPTSFTALSLGSGARAPTKNKKESSDEGMEASRALVHSYPVSHHQWGWRKVQARDRKEESRKYTPGEPLEVTTPLRPPCITSSDEISQCSELAQHNQVLRQWGKGYLPPEPFVHIFPSFCHWCWNCLQVTVLSTTPVTVPSTEHRINKKPAGWLAGLIN